LRTVPFVRIGEIATQIRGVTYSKEEASDSPRADRLPILRANNITEDGLIFDELVFVPRARISADQLLVPGDVVIAASSGSLDIVGKSARVNVNFDGSFGAFCKVLRPSREVDASYFSHYFRTPEYRRTISGLAAGANINNLKNEHLNDLLIPLPSLEEQRRIAAILDKADALCQKRRAVLQRLETLTRSLFLEMFGDPLVNPMRWPMQALGGLLELIQYGPRFYNEPYTELGVRIARITDLDSNGKLDFSKMPRLDVNDQSRKKHLLKPGDLIFARTGATVGKLSLIRNGDPPCIAGAYFIRLHFRADTVEPTYIRYVLASPSIQALIAKQSRQAAQQNFSGPALRRLQIALPPPSLQRIFSQRLLKLATVANSVDSSQHRLDVLFSSLQHGAFRGEL
jgi:type I restriction enzyme, S subunit